MSLWANRRGCGMKRLFNLTSKLAAKINTLIREEEKAHPDMPEVAAMVYVGDVYALREQSQLAKTTVGEPIATPVTIPIICDYGD